MRVVLAHLIGKGRTAQPLVLGRLESEVLEVLWCKGSGSVHQVRTGLSRHLAYTTVMTTLDRLFKKGLLERHKVDRSFRYTPRISQQQWTQAQSNSGPWEQLLPGPTLYGPMLASYLVDGVEHYDEALLVELEKKIADRRRQFEQKEKG